MAINRRNFWSNYKDIYDIYKNGTKMYRVYGKRKAQKQAEIEAGNIFDGRARVDVVNIFTGEIIYTQ